MDVMNKQFRTANDHVINYYEVDNMQPLLLIIHAQGTSSISYSQVIKELSHDFHIVLIDCYGHGKSSHDSEIYNIRNQGDDLIEFIQTKTNEKATILGHSSGGLIACYMASQSDRCKNLILEDPPLFSCYGENRYNTFNYKDLSTVCHHYIHQKEERDFVYYYFMHQYCWNFFPEKSRDKIRYKLGKFALKDRKKHPDKTLKIPFWPKKFLAGFHGLNDYDPYFGETFYDNTFHCDVDYEDLLLHIKVPALLMKANTTIGDDGLLQGAMSDEDVEHVKRCLHNIKVEYFDCGHGIHNEKPKQFIKSVIEASKHHI